MSIEEENTSIGGILFPLEDAVPLSIPADQAIEDLDPKLKKVLMEFMGEVALRRGGADAEAADQGPRH